MSCFSLPLLLKVEGCKLVVCGRCSAACCRLCVLVFAITGTRHAQVRRLGCRRAMRFALRGTALKGSIMLKGLNSMFVELRVRVVS